MLNAWDVLSSEDRPGGSLSSSAPVSLSVTSALAELNVDENCECAYNIFDPAYTGQFTEPRTDPCARQFL
jgi:hypothetical protein